MTTTAIAAAPRTTITQAPRAPTIQTMLDVFAAAGLVYQPETGQWRAVLSPPEIVQGMPLVGAEREGVHFFAAKRRLDTNLCVADAHNANIRDLYEQLVQARSAGTGGHNVHQ